MSKANNLTDFLVNTANAIRTAEGSTALINPQDFESHILALGGGITPTGNIELTTNLSTDVSSYATATVRSASGYSLSASGNSSTEVTVGSINGQYYPVSATLTGSLTASTPGWFSSSGTVSAGTHVVGRIKKINIGYQEYEPHSVNGTSMDYPIYNGWTGSLNNVFFTMQAGYLSNSYIALNRPTPLYPFGNYLNSYSTDITDTTMVQRYTDWQVTLEVSDNFNDSLSYYVTKTILFSTSSTTTTVATGIADGSGPTFTAGGKAIMLNIYSDEYMDAEWYVNVIIKNAYGQEVLNLADAYDYFYGRPFVSFSRATNPDITNSEGTAEQYGPITILIYWAYTDNKMNLYCLS